SLTRRAGSTETRKMAAALLSRSLLHDGIGLDGNGNVFGDEFAFGGFVDEEIAVETGGSDPVGLRTKRDGEHRAFVAFQREGALAIFAVIQAQFAIHAADSQFISIRTEGDGMNGTWETLQLFDEVHVSIGGGAALVFGDFVDARGS